jgi:hypothetical protein
MWIIGATIALKAASIIVPGLLGASRLETLDLGLLLGASLLLLLGGAAIRVWERHLADQTEQRTIELRIKAAEKVTQILTNPSAVPATPQYPV